MPLWWAMPISPSPSSWQGIGRRVVVRDFAPGPTRVPPGSHQGPTRHWATWDELWPLRLRQSKYFDAWRVTASHSCQLYWYQLYHIMISDIHGRYAENCHSSFIYFFQVSEMMAKQSFSGFFFVPCMCLSIVSPSPGFDGSHSNAIPTHLKRDLSMQGCNWSCLCDD